MSEDDKWGAGNRNKWSDHGKIMMRDKLFPLICGEYPHSRQDNRYYIDMGGKEPVEFDGYRILIDINIKSNNYMKESHLSGNQIRKGGTAAIIADGIQIYEFFFRDPQWALRRADQLISQLSEHPSGWLNREERSKLRTKKIYYREIPAVINRLIDEQGCLIIVPEQSHKFPTPIWARDEQNYYYDKEDSQSAKVEVLDHNIWWFRK